jgi:hypothetical protein
MISNNNYTTTENSGGKNIVLTQMHPYNDQNGMLKINTHTQKVFWDMQPNMMELKKENKKT